MKIVAGCPVAERAWILQEWIDSLRGQRLDRGDELEIVCLYTRSHDQTLSVLQRNEVITVVSPLPSRPYDRMLAHYWSYQDHEYEYMASLRNDLRSIAIALQADLFLSIDSDILFKTKEDLQSLIDTMRAYAAHAVAPLVNMEKYATNSPSWNWMDLRFDGVGGVRPDVSVSPSKVSPFRVDVIMAAMLLDRRAQMIPWKNHPQGEDIGWSIKARRADLKLVIDSSVECEHRMRP